MKAIEFRDARDDDRAFVVKSWLDSFRGSHAAGLISMADWPQVMGPQIVRLLNNGGTRVIVAYAPDDDTQILGWAAVRPNKPPFVLYVYTKHVFRRLGVARRTLAAAGVALDQPFTYAAKTPVVTRIASKIPRARWTPLEARY